MLLHTNSRVKSNPVCKSGIFYTNAGAGMRLHLFYSTKPRETGILNVPFAHTAPYYDNFVEVPGIEPQAIKQAVAIKCTDGRIYPSRLSMNAPTIWDGEGDGSDIVAAFGDIATDGSTFSSYDVFCFKIDETKVYVRRVILVE